MRSLNILLSTAALCGSLAAAGPALTGVVNPASNIPPGLPNYGIAKGSIFVVYGSNIGPATLTQATALPFPTSGVGGTSVAVTVNGTTVAAPMIYSVQSQVAAILPSNTPAGTGSLTVTFNGATGTIPITVVTTNFGISTVNQSGSGAAVLTYPDYSLVTATKSAKPGDTVVIWGTGLGPISGSDAIIPASTDLGTPIQVYLGGVQATVLYRGRSASPGLDQINILVPQGVTAGCSVSLVIQTGSLVSNTTSLSLAAGGGTCSDPGAAPVPPSPSGTLTYKFGSLSLINLTETLSVAGQISTINNVGASAGFEQVTLVQGTGGLPGPIGNITITSAGSCSVITSLISLAAPAGGTPTGGATVKPLDAGSSMSLLLPSGSPVVLTSPAKGVYSASLSSLSSGSYQFSNGAGGADLGPFKVNLTLGTPLIRTNQSVAMTSIDRTKPFTITWTGGDPKGQAQISLTSESINTTALTAALATVSCTAPVSAGQFTVPPYVLLSLIPNATSNVISVNDFNLQTLTIPGLDVAYAFAENSTGVATTTTVFK